MIKRILPLLTCLLPLASFAVEAESGENVCLHMDSEALRKAADRYLDCINQISQGVDFSQTDAMEIISPGCKKVLNGQLFTQSREAFLMDLRLVYENQGSWKVYPADIIVAPATNTVVLRLFIEMEKLGAYTAIVILRFDSDCLITEINEVLNQVKGSYDFTASNPSLFVDRQGNAVLSISGLKQ